MEDMELGMNMFRKGKLHILPQKTGNLSEVKAGFQEVGNQDRLFILIKRKYYGIQLLSWLYA